MDTKCFAPNTSEQIEEIEKLGLKPEWLQRVCMRALAAYNQKTTNDALIAGGLYTYLEAVKSLRDELCPKGWLKKARNNVELVTNLEKGLSVMVSSGNSDTGMKHGNPPKTKNPKGIQTQKYVLLNNKQMVIPSMKRSIKSVSFSHTWILLYHIDEGKKQMRLELSLPVKMDMDGLRINSWRKRIIITPIDFTNSPELNSLKQEFSPDIDIDLERKINE